jgi:hypothetical protein
MLVRHHSCVEHSKQKGKQTKKQEQTNESKVVIMWCNERISYHDAPVRPICDVCRRFACGVYVWVCALCGEVELTRYAYWCKCVQIWEWRARPFFGGRWSRCGCHRSESHPATILTYLGIICTWEYWEYPYYPFVSSMSFGSMICVSSLRVWLTYQVATKRLHVHLIVHQFAVHSGLCVVR